MGRVIADAKKLMKKITLIIKRSWRKVKYLDKTQLNYFIVTGFIGVFCVFTTFTYSALTVSKYLSAATITIAKLNYTLTSSNSDYNSGVIIVGANSTETVDLTLTSLNPIKTKYALNYSTTSSDATVYYSQNLKNNMIGIIGPNGSSITMRVVIENTGDTDATITFTVQGGYIQNSLTTNILAGFYEQDITVRTILLDANFENATPTANFPLKTESYAYYKTECTEAITPEWDYNNWKLNLNNLNQQVACDVYFKKLENDIEIYFMLQDANGENGELATSVPNDGTYSFQKATCSTGVSATWDTTNWQLSVSDITDRTLCVAYFNSN